MQICFLRHGEAEPAAPGGTDESRKLTDRGKRDVRAVGEMLWKARTAPQVILTSPLLRARQTGEVLQEVLGCPAQADERLRSGATLGGLQELIAGRAEERLLLVGHEPDFSMIVCQLTGGHVKIKTSGLARVEAERFEPGRGLLMWLISPDLIAAD